VTPAWDADSAPIQREVGVAGGLILVVCFGHGCVPGIDEPSSALRLLTNWDYGVKSTDTAHVEQFTAPSGIVPSMPSSRVGSPIGSMCRSVCA